jgi:hypothetical protein
MAVSSTDDWIVATEVAKSEVEDKPALILAAFLFSQPAIAALFLSFTV